MQYCWSVCLYMALVMVSLCAYVHTSPFPLKPLDTIAYPNNNSKVPIHEIVPIGDVEGKGYFYDISNQLTWNQAKAYCNSAGLHLATITTAAELTFLINSNSAGLLPDRPYWTGGREARKWRMFSWDRSDNELPSFFTGEIVSYLEPDYYACLMFQSGKSLLATLECDNIMFALCES